MSKRIISIITLLLFSAGLAGCSNTPREFPPETSIPDSVLEYPPEEYTEMPAESIQQDDEQGDSEHSVIKENEDLTRYDSLYALKSAIKSGYSNETLQYPSSNENFEYNVYESYVQITKYVGKSNTAVFPSMIDNLPVKVIGDGFVKVIDYEKTPVSEITIESEIEIIDDCAFSCNGYTDDNGKYHELSGILKRINFSNGLLYIGHEAFYNCRGLTELKLPESLVGIGSHAFSFVFSENAKASLTIPESVKLIGSGAFETSNKSLSALTILSDNFITDTEYDVSAGYIIPCKNDGIEITVHGHVGSSAAQLAADTRQKFVVITN